MADGPARKLVLLRHAKSAWPDVPDYERPLARRGQRDAPLMGRWLRSAGHVPGPFGEKILSLTVPRDVPQQQSGPAVRAPVNVTQAAEGPAIRASWRHHRLSYPPGQPGSHAVERGSWAASLPPPASPDRGGCRQPKARRPAVTNG